MGAEPPVYSKYEAGSRLLKSVETFSRVSALHASDNLASKEKQPWVLNLLFILNTWQSLWAPSYWSSQLDAMSAKVTQLWLAHLSHAYSWFQSMHWGVYQEQTSILQSRSLWLVPISSLG